MEINIDNAIQKAVNEKLESMGIAHQEDDQILTAQETVEYIGHGLSYSTLMRECRKGNMPCFRIGNKVYFRKSKLLEWITDQEGGTA